MPANAWLPSTAPVGDRHPSGGPTPPGAPVPRGQQQKTPKLHLTGRKRRRREGARPTRAGRCGQGNGPAISPPDSPSTADPSSLGPHLGPQRRWLVRPTYPIGSHIRAPPVQEGRVQDISEVSAQFPLGLCRDTAAGPRGQSGRKRRKQEADSEPEAAQAWPGLRLISQE